MLTEELDGDFCESDSKRLKATQSATYSLALRAFARANQPSVPSVTTVKGMPCHEMLPGGDVHRALHKDDDAILNAWIVRVVQSSTIRKVLCGL